MNYKVNSYISFPPFLLLSFPLTSFPPTHFLFLLLSLLPSPLQYWGSKLGPCSF